MDAGRDFRAGCGRVAGRVVATAAAAVVLALSLVGIHDALARGDGRAETSRAAAVDINGFAYHPPTLHIARGGAVAFTNSSGTAHTATRRGSFDTGRIKPGKTAVVHLRQRGTFAYHCTIHPFMHGRIIVE